MDGKKKIWATAVLCAVASVGFVVPAGAEETMTHDLDEVIVEADRNTLPGGFVANNDRVGILGNIKAIDVPFTQKKYTEKTIMTFYDPNQPLNGTLANTPSIRIGSTSPMYTDFSMRGVNMNASHYYINGIPNMFNQTRSIPAYILSSVDIVSGPNTVLNGATFSNNGTNGTDAPAGLLNGTTKRAAADPVTRYTQRFSGRSTWTEDLDLGRRFGKNNEWGIRVNAHNEDGGLSIKGADVRDKSIYINLDHQDAKSMTNIFGGYYDWKVSSGNIFYRSTDILADNTSLPGFYGQQIALIPQNPGDSLNPLRTIGRQFGDILQTAGLNDKTNQRKRQLLTFFGLPDAERVLAAYPHELSGGMLQRVLCAMSICCSPLWLLADEPTKGLDETACGVVYENLQKIKTSQSLGMLIITHDLQLARSICADIAVMYAGQIVEYGPQVLTGPRHPYTQAFLAALPENGFQPLPGLPPLPQNHLPGCRFAPRCPSCQKRCLQEVPPVYDSGTAKVRCFLYA